MSRVNHLYQPRFQSSKIQNFIILIIPFFFCPQVKTHPKKTLNIAIVGDEDTGKTSLIMAYKGEQFNRSQVATVFDTYSCDIQVDGESVQLELCDIAGQECHGSERKFVYRNCNAFVVCYAVDSYESLFNVMTKWLPELEHFSQSTVPIILAATKKDLRRRPSTMVISNYNEQQNFVTYNVGLYVAGRIGASRFLETSAFRNDGVQELFHNTVRIILDKQEKQLSRKKNGESCCPCCIL